MNDRESRRAEHEAQRDLADRPTQSARHEHDLNRYLGSVHYKEVQAHREPAAGPRPASKDMHAASPPVEASPVVVGVDEPPTASVCCGAAATLTLPALRRRT